MNSTRKNGLITFGIIVVLLNVLLILFFALRFDSLFVPETVLSPVTPISFTQPVSLP